MWSQNMSKDEINSPYTIKQICRTQVRRFQIRRDRSSMLVSELCVL
jgi:hypothetical protein